MTRLHTHIAKRDIYEKGAQIPSTKTKSGFRRDRSKPFDKKDKIFVKTGETYYTWSFRYGGSFESKTMPRRSQLTQSSFLSTLYDLEDRLSTIRESVSSDSSDFESFRDDLVSDIEGLRDETQDKLDNMPEGLQQGDTGQLLQERIDNLDNWISELQGIDTDIDEDLNKEEKISRIDEIADEFVNCESNCG